VSDYVVPLLAARRALANLEAYAALRKPFEVHEEYLKFIEAEIELGLAIKRQFPLHRTGGEP
jgi:hypothetical protein